MSIKSKTLYITMAITLVAFTYYIAEQWYQFKRNTELLHKEQVSIVENYYENFPMRILMLLRSSTGFLLSDKDIAEAFVNHDREALDKISKRYYSYINMVFSRSGMVLNFITKEGDVIYRAQAPERYGDSIADRGMIADAMRENRSVQGIEMGRKGLFLRHVQPVMFKNGFAGFIETGVHISFFAKRIESIAGIKTLVLVDKEHAAYNSANLPTVGGITEYFNNTGMPLDIFIKRFRAEKGISYVRLEGKDFEIIKEFALKNYKGEKIGDYVFFAERSSLHSWFFGHIIYMVIIGVFGIFVVMYVVRKGFVKSIEELEIEHRVILNELVMTNIGLEDRIKQEVENNREKDLIINQQKKVADMGQMLSALAHHWRQPINAVGLYIQDVMDAYRSGELDEEYIKQFEKTSLILLKNLSDSIDSYKAFYKPSEDSQDIRVADVVCDIVSLLDSSLKANGVKMLFSADCSDYKFGYKKFDEIDKCGCEGLCVHGPVNEFKQSLMNIIFNAMDAVGEKYGEKGGGEIKIRLTEHDTELTLDITDNGSGIRNEDMDMIFNPFFSTKDEGQGVGLGLYMAKTVLERHMGGKLTVTCYDGETSFRTSLKKV
jgi:signal transduction histidine kinase